jgi:acetylornithine/N-succinyldiaminopimelate aminotransferase
MPIFDVYPINDIAIARGQGSYIWDENGRQYLDFYGGHAVVSIGHTHPHYVARIKEQLNRIGFYSNSIRIPLQEELARKLGVLSGKEEYQLFLCNSGAEANENALKLASFHTGRKKVVAFSKSFHGRTSLAVSATDNRRIVAPVNETEHVVFLPYNDIDALKEYFDVHGNGIAGVIIEAIQGVGGINIATADFLQAIRTLCDQHQSVFIADEVQCGYGRAGMFFAADHAGVQADIYTTAKGMGNGFPIGGVLIAPHIRPRHGMLGTTFGGNHLACAAALAVLEVMEQERLMEHAASEGTYLLHELAVIPGIEQARGKGLMIGFNAHKELRAKLLNVHSIFTGAAGPDVVRLLPALNIGRRESDMLLSAIREEL